MFLWRRTSMKAGTKKKTYNYYKDYDKYDNKTNFDWK